MKQVSLRRLILEHPCCLQPRGQDALPAPPRASDSELGLRREAQRERAAPMARARVQLQRCLDGFLFVGNSRWSRRPAPTREVTEQAIHQLLPRGRRDASGWGTREPVTRTAALDPPAPLELLELTGSVWHLGDRSDVLGTYRRVRKGPEHF